MRLRLRPNRLIVLEGPDGTGKTTQFDLLKKLSWSYPEPLFTHSPSGSTYIGSEVYKITERQARLHPWARQFLHLAAHAQEYHTIILPTLHDQAVIMDRCWWSTIAYGYFRDELMGLTSLSEFRRLALLPTQGRVPDLVLLFTHEWEHDPNNNERLREGYRSLLRSNQETTAVVPPLPPDETREFILNQMMIRGHLDPRP